MEIIVSFMLKAVTLSLLRRFKMSVTYTKIDTFALGFFMLSDSGIGINFGYYIIFIRREI